MRRLFFSLAVVVFLVSAAWAAPLHLSGKVQEVLNSGGYTYLRLDIEGKQVWAAVPTTKVEAGEKVTLQAGAEMQNFHSKTLNRTFPSIIFSNGVAGRESMNAHVMEALHKGVKDKGAPGKGGASSKAAPSPATVSQAVAKIHPKAAPLNAKVGKVAKAKGANAYTLKELLARHAQLEKKPVTIRGKVVKVNRGILKMNWVHIADGSGKASDILVSTGKETGYTPVEGDVVTANGTLRNRIDFGAGYKYDMILMETTYRRN